MKSLSKSVKRARFSGDVFHLEDSDIKSIGPDELEQIIREKQDMAYKKGQREGQKTGLNEGINRGKQEQRHELEQQIHLVAQLLDETQSKNNRFIQDSENDVVEMAVRIAEKVVQLEVQNTDTVKKLAKSAISRAVDKSHVEIRVNPGDFAVMEEIKPKFLSSIKGLEELVIIQDPAISQGGCLVVTASGNIDAQIESQFEEIKLCLGL